MKHKLTIIRYRTAKQCFAAYHNSFSSKLPKSWTFFDRAGKKKHQSMKACLSYVRNLGCWGWCSNKSVLHLWVSSRAKMPEAIALIAHEIGHCQHPFEKGGKEEQKAAKYEKVARTAVDIYLDFKAGVGL